MGDDNHDARVATSSGAAALVSGLARFAGALVELSAGASGSLVDVDEGRAAQLLAQGWDLAAFTPTGELVLEVLEAAGARVELVAGVSSTWGRGRRGRGAWGRGGVLEGAGFQRATSHAPAGAAWGAPPGRRVSAMAMMPGPDGDLVRASCGLVLRLPAAAVDDLVRVSWMLTWHAAMYAAERRALPATGRLAVALDELDLARGVPRAIGARVGWADEVAGRVVAEVGIARRED